MSLQIPFSGASKTGFGGGTLEYVPPPPKSHDTFSPPLRIPKLFCSRTREREEASEKGGGSSCIESPGGECSSEEEVGGEQGAQRVSAGGPGINILLGEGEGGAKPPPRVFRRIVLGTKQSIPNMTGRPGCRTMEMIGGSSVSYLARTPYVPLFSTLFNRGGNRRAFRLPGESGDHFHCTVEPSPGHIRRRNKSSNSEESSEDCPKSF